MDDCSPSAATVSAPTHTPAFARWTAKRKAAVVRSILEGETTFDATCARLDLTPEELQSWISAYERAAVNGNPVGALYVKRMIVERTPQASLRDNWRYTPDTDYLRLIEGGKS